ncbi:MAG: GtrA family protein [Candidatus Nanopelagicales bacterium]|nr:GtrA family protein [Candidatus Nanopelagicales bacterium]
MPPIIGQAIRFVTVGLASAAVDFCFLYLLHGVLGLAVAPAAFLAFWSSFFVNFALNRSWSFGAQAFRPGPQVARFVILVIANSLATVAAVAGLVAIGIPYLYAKIVTLAFLACLNFFLLRYWVFRAPTDGPDSPIDAACQASSASVQPSFRPASASSESDPP